MSKFFEGEMQDSSDIYHVIWFELICLFQFTVSPITVLQHLYKFDT